jgi:hypothetical protein
MEKVPVAYWTKLFVKFARLIWLQFVLLNVPSKIVTLDLLTSMPDDFRLTLDPSGWAQSNTRVDSARTPAKDAKRRTKTVKTVWDVFGVFTVFSLV